MDVIALTPQTGGVLNTEQVIGRDAEVDEIKEILTNQGVVLNAVRRFGKSSVLIKLKTELESSGEFLPIYLHVEGVQNGHGFVQKLTEDIKPLIQPGFIEKAGKVFDAFAAIMPKIGGIELAQRKHIWETQLVHLIQGLNQNHPDKKIVIMLDEFSIMLDSIGDKDEASVLIGLLRSLVQNPDYQDHLRFVYCGSIGMDLVMDKLKRAGKNIGEPLNHMKPYELQPLTSINGLYLASCFNLGCSMDLSEEVMKYLCLKCECIPYFIDVTFAMLRNKEENTTQGHVDKVIDEILNNNDDQFDFKHFYDRIELHYSKPDLSICILSYLSKQDDYTSEIDVLNNLSQQIEITREVLIVELDRLRGDDYLLREIKDDERHYNFRYQILRRWWKINRAY